MVVGGKIFMRAEGIPRDEENEVMLAGSKWRLTPRSWTWPVILDRRFKMERAARWLSGSPSI
jgi:hypothetical protein